MSKLSGNEFTPIVKPIGFRCNLDCRYCFYHEIEKKKSMMSDKVLEAVIRETFRANEARDVVNFIWHGGEPLLAGINFYQRVLEIQEKYSKSGQRVINGIQTNGVLIDHIWAEFFKENNFSIGVSIDGPKRFHDEFRVFPDKSGSFDHVMDGIDVLRDLKVPFGLVMVVTKTSVDEPETIFDFLKRNKFYKAKLSRALGRKENGDLRFYSPKPEDYGNFLLNFMHLWLDEDNPKMEFTPINEIFTSLLAGRGCSQCLFSNSCNRFWVINSDGGVYPCMTEGLGEDWQYGEIVNGFESIRNSRKFREFTKLNQEIRESCKGCKWYELCGGGCAIDYNLNHPKLGNRNVLCSSFKKLFSEAENVLNEYDML